MEVESQLCLYIERNYAMLGRLPCAGVRSSTSTGPTRGSQWARQPSPAQSAKKSPRKPSVAQSAERST